MSDSGAKLVLSSRKNAAVAADAIAVSSSSAKVIVLDDVLLDDDDVGDLSPPVSVDVEADLATILYTSGERAGTSIIHSLKV